ncbi:alpha/beta fold hydrolase [Agromyces kandeliae]|uniref:Alpha/beta fold hydrolase n=1 Tax=Agromyces kandeliae TaxID=2666141 RepID=A0A6L5R6L3_9MICO|nr:alpha/beta hydrolase [Agromyces kandeliae]MRX44817.1 alpha/beta fold hydrolase [Agromyces kandeliae]
MDTPMPEASGFDHLTIATRGLASHVAVVGEGAPVVMLHGFPQHWWQWRDIGPRLAERGYRVICPDLRGAGWTVAESPRIERETRRHDLVALLDAMGFDRVRLVGHDMGAMAAMQLAYTDPERVEALVWLAAPPPFMSFSPKMLGALRHLPPLVWHRPGRSLAAIFGEAYAVRPLAPVTVETYLAPMRRPEVDAAVRWLYRGMVLPEAVRIARGAYTAQRLRPPTLCAFGRRDGAYSEADLRRLTGDPTRYADHFEFAFIDDASHFITDDAPEAVSEVILEHFARADASA